MVDTLKGAINALADPHWFISLRRALLLCRSSTARRSGSRRSPWRCGVLAAVFLYVSMFDKNFALIVRKPDNVPIVAMLFLVGFFVWLAMYQAHRNDERIAAGAAAHGSEQRGEREDLGLARPRLHRAPVHDHRR